MTAAKRSAAPKRPRTPRKVKASAPPATSAPAPSVTTEVTRLRDAGGTHR